MNPTPNPLPAFREGAMMYLITAGSAVIKINWQKYSPLLGSLTQSGNHFY
jgi:uncharacterized membrane protein (Fun14 family)